LITEPIGELVAEMPEYVNPVVREFMKKCWQFKPEDRPDFDEIQQFASNTDKLMT